MNGECSLSVVIATYDSQPYLRLTLESWAVQQARNFEVIVVDDGPDERVRAMCKQLAPRLPIKYLPTTGVGRAAARNRGLRAADGELVLIASDCGVVAPDASRVLARTGDAEIAVMRRAGWLSSWEAGMPGATNRRVLDSILRRPQLGATLDSKYWGAARQMLITPAQVQDEATLQAAAVEDLVWERLAPALAAHGPELTDFALPWLFGVAGYACVRRATLFEAGLLDERARGWDFEDPDLSHRLHLAKLRHRVVEARVFHQLRPLHAWPLPEVDAVARVGARDPLHGWLLARFYANESVSVLAELAAAHTGAAPHTEAALREACATLLRSLDVTWRDVWR